MYAFRILFTRKIAVKNISDKKEIESNVRIILNRIQVSKPLELRPSIGYKLVKKQNLENVECRKAQMMAGMKRTVSEINELKRDNNQSACKVRRALEEDEMIDKSYVLGLSSELSEPKGVTAVPRDQIRFCRVLRNF